MPTRTCNNTSIAKTMLSLIRGEQGDTIVEVLCAMLVASLALMLLSMSISTAVKLSADSKASMDATYAMEEALAAATPSAGTTGTVYLETVDGDPLLLVPEGETCTISYTIAEDQPATLPIVSYVVEEP